MSQTPILPTQAFFSKFKLTISIIESQFPPWSLVFANAHCIMFAWLLQTFNKSTLNDTKPRKWFSRHRQHFRSSRLLSYAIVVSLVECAIVGSILGSLGTTGFAVLLPCSELIPVFILLIFCLEVRMFFDYSLKTLFFCRVATMCFIDAHFPAVNVGGVDL